MNLTDKYTKKTIQAPSSKNGAQPILGTIDAAMDGPLAVRARVAPDDVSQRLVPVRVLSARTPVWLALDAWPFSPPHPSDAPHRSFLLTL
jgi:hypothetical protein